MNLYIDAAEREKAEHLAEELSFAEQALSTDDRYDFIRSLMASEELSRLPSWPSDGGPHARELTCWQLPDYSHVDVKPTPDAIHYAIAKEYVFSPVPQTNLIAINTNNLRPYLRLTMSECSAVIGRNENELLVAHIGFSQEVSFRAALKTFQEHGVEAPDIQAVVSVGPYQEHMAATYAGTKRLTTVNAYEEYGLRRENCHPFTYSFNEAGTRHERLAEIIVGRDGQLLSLFDANFVRSHGTFREDPDETTRLNRFIPSL